MTHDAKLMGQARAALNEHRAQRAREQSRREAEVYAKSPRAKELSRAIELTMHELFALALKDGAQENELNDIKTRNLALQDTLRRELRTSGFPESYLDDKPYCELCKDTGSVGRHICDCLEELYKAELSNSLSSLFKLGRESFDTFKLEYYDDEPPPARAIMEGVFKACRTYAYNFGPSSPNLLMSGAPGLGKTFLSAAIARVVAENGSSVVYDTVTSILSRLEDEKFSRTDDTDAVRAETRRLRECDLLIADDLGTEMTTSFAVAALYELINTRLITGKKTIISTNLSPEELAKRYSPQIASRLMGEYTVLRFYGTDIRQKKRDQSCLP